MLPCQFLIFHGDDNNTWLSIMIVPLLCLSGSLMYLNEATLLNNVRLRYSKDKIYVSETDYELNL